MSNPDTAAGIYKCNTKVCTNQVVKVIKTVGH